MKSADTRLSLLLGEKVVQGVDRKESAGVEPPPAYDVSDAPGACVLCHIHTHAYVYTHAHTFYLFLLHVHTHIHTHADTRRHTHAPK
jgi:hypothetical protein